MQDNLNYNRFENNQKKYKSQYYKQKKARKKRILIYRLKLIVFCLIVIFLLFMMFSAIKNKNSREKSSTSQITSSQETSSNSDLTHQQLNQKSFETWNNSCDWTMRIINESNPKPSDYKVTTQTYQKHEVDVRILPYLKDMVGAASKDGINLQIVSAYRSDEKQTTLYNQQVKTEQKKGLDLDSAKEEAKKTVAKPGTSEHQIGLAVDFNNLTDKFTDTKEYEWLHAHSHEYGFIQRYSRDKSDITGVINEPWHYRFVGKDNAKAIEDSGLCMEEYVNNIENK